MIDIRIKRIDQCTIETNAKLDPYEISDVLDVLEELKANLKAKLIEKFINYKKKGGSEND
jgi:hypothetical protein